MAGKQNRTRSSTGSLSQSDKRANDILTKTSNKRSDASIVPVNNMTDYSFTYGEHSQGQPNCLNTTTTNATTSSGDNTTAINMMQIMLQKMDGQQADIREIRNDQRTILGKIADIEQTCSMLVQKTNLHDADISQLRSDVDQLQDVQTQINEKLERARRANNLVAFGIPEDDNALITLRKIFNIILPGTNLQIASERRIGKEEGDKVRPCRITLNNNNEFHTALRNAKMLHDKLEFQHIYIKPDETPLQQQLRKRRREEMENNGSEFETRQTNRAFQSVRRIQPSASTSVSSRIPRGSGVKRKSSATISDAIAGPSKRIANDMDNSVMTGSEEIEIHDVDLNND